MTIFGREDSPRVMEYFGAINRFYMDLIAAESQLNDTLAALSRDDQESADFRSDINAQIEFIQRGKIRLRKNLDKQRREMGL